MRSSILATLAILLTACATDDDAGPVVPELGGGKADAIDHVDDQGAIAFATARTGSFTEDLQFFGYRMAVRDGARVRVEITQLGTAKKLDTTLFVYGPRQGEAFGDTAIAFDDDSGWGRQSRLIGVELGAGEYLVVVGTHDARGRGAFRLLTTCESGDCDPLPEPIGCDETVANNILSCVAIQVADTQADPETPDLTRAEALEICTDGEALGPVFDNLCAAPQPPAFCAGGFDAFAQTMGPACHDELLPFAVDCVFGDEYRDLETSADIVSAPRRRLTSPAGLSDIEREQVIRAVQSSAHTDVVTVEEAFERADSNEINQTELWDRTSARPYVAYEFGAGDTSVGAYFVHDSAERVAVISDGSLERCSAARGPQGADCTIDGGIGPGTCEIGTCIGTSEGSNVGRCTVLSGFGEQTMCSPDDPCDIGQGLICAGLTRTDDGICFPAWMRGNFGEPDLFLDVPDADAEGLSRTILAYGLATVDMDVEIDLWIEHANPSQLRVTLTNPAGTEVELHTNEPDAFIVDGPVLGFSGDESVNGPWTLRIVDETSGSAGVLDRWTLHLGSRFD